MKKTPTLFKRDPDDRRHLLPAVTPGCEWVINGEGVATRKYDGTCVMFDGERWWARREVKPGKTAPEGWVFVTEDETTGKSMGWEPAEQSGWTKFLSEAIDTAILEGDALDPGTYELCGPKVQGNPEGYLRHVLVPHDKAGVFDLSPYMHDGKHYFEGLRHFLTKHMPQNYEGIVWHHEDGRMVKLKRRDFA